MGLFSKIRDNLTHGGVKLSLKAPISVPAGQVIPVTVSLASTTSQTINSIKAEIKAQARQQGIGMGNGAGMGIEEGQTTYQTVAQVENRGSFTLNPGEPKTVTLELYINGASIMGQANNVNGGLGGALQSVLSAAQSLEHITYIYSVHASADVQGITLDPNDKQPIQIIPQSAAPGGIALAQDSADAPATAAQGPAVESPDTAQQPGTSSTTDSTSPSQ
jgi:hypothetical protein